MFAIREATDAFAKIDRLPKDRVPTLDKTLRNLTQRTYFPPVERDGRTDHFALETICALRLVHKAAAFGLDRAKLEIAAQFLQQPQTGQGRRVKIPGGWKVLRPIDEAIERAKAGEAFNLVIELRRDGTTRTRMDWAADESMIDAKAKAEAEVILADSGLAQPMDAAFVIPASRLIAELLEELSD
ncbi:hypothetical protein V8J36_09210 [Frigidibacter sp. MR17.14]|uniref:hypothetical protein n=1 Tax=Frigidibacter sp. MR17.14 TaxID=3126509 RepID=UPI0030130F43